jgi:hypothetical protein
VATGKINYATASDLSMTLASLASDTNLLAGQESSAVDNTVDGRRDYWVSGKVSTGTSPTASRSIQVWAVGAMDSSGSLWPTVFDGTNSAETIPLAEIKNAVCKFVAEMATTSTSNQQYDFGPVLISSVFGGSVPARWSLFITHNTGVALNATSGNHQIRIQPEFDTVS